MPVLVDEDSRLVFPRGWADQTSDPYGFGLPYRDHISRFVEAHREKIHRGARRCPFNSLIVRPVGTRERQENPAAKKAMDKEWNRLREMGVWDESDVREWADVAAEAVREKREVHFGWIFPSAEKRTASWQKMIL